MRTRARPDEIDRGLDEVAGPHPFGVVLHEGRPGLRGVHPAVAAPVELLGGRPVRVAVISAEPRSRLLPSAILALFRICERGIVGRTRAIGNDAFTDVIPPVRRKSLEMGTTSCQWTSQRSVCCHTCSTRRTAKIAAELTPIRGRQ